MRGGWEGAFALGLLAGFAEAATGALETSVFLLVVALLFAADLLVNLPALVLEVFAEAPAFLVGALVEAGFEGEEDLTAAGLTAAVGFGARFVLAVAVGSATVEPAFADLALCVAPLVETGAFVF